MSEEKNIEGSEKLQASSDKPVEKEEQQTIGNKQLATSEPQTSNIKPEASTMEVHKHPHHVTHKKKWGEYFLEFLMLFLAVFLGFVAENIREHQVEKNRGRQYIISLYEDLKTDTARLSEMLLYDDDKIAGLNNMESCFDTVSKNLAATDCMGQLILHSRANRAFTLTDRTTTQLANAGGFRILDKEDADSILSYVNFYKEYQDFQATIFQSAQDNVRNTLNELASFKIVKSLLQPPGSNRGTTTSTITADMVPQGPLLFSNDKALLNKWFNQLLVYQRITKRQHMQLSDLLIKLTGLIKYYKIKYHLD